VSEGLEGAPFGTTLVIALVDETTADACVANVGDSRAYVLDERGARQISRDHSIVAERVAAGQLTLAEARHAPDRNVLTRAVGIHDSIRVDLFGPRGLRPGDRLLLCSDGIHGLLEDAELATISDRLSAGELPAALIEEANARGGSDNASAVVIEAPSRDGGQSRRGAGPLEFLKALRRDDPWPFVTRRASSERAALHRSGGHG
jgi:protein phosphatase